MWCCCSIRSALLPTALTMASTSAALSVVCCWLAQQRPMHHAVRCASTATAFASVRSSEALTLKSALPADAASPRDARSIAVAVVGAPNAGKSTLVNALVGKKVSSVSSKYNTTRGRVLGLLRDGSTEVVLTDTPGFVRPHDAAGRRYEPDLVNAAVQSVPSADVALLVIDVARRWDEEQQESYASVLRLAVASGCLPLLVANKADLLRGQPLSDPQRVLADDLWQEFRARTAAASAAAAAAGLEQGRGSSRGLRERGRGSSTDGTADPTHVRMPLGPIRDVLGLKLTILWRWLEEEAIRAGMLLPPPSPSSSSSQSQQLTAVNGSGRSPDDSRAGAGTPLLPVGTAGLWGLQGPYMWFPRPEDALDEQGALLVDRKGGQRRSASPPSPTASVAAGSTSASASATASGPQLIRMPNLYKAAGVNPILPVSAVQGTPVIAVAGGSSSGRAQGDPAPSLSHDKSGLAHVRQALLRLALPRPWRYASAQGATDASALELVTLAVREPLFESLHGDVPYKVRLAVRGWTVKDSSSAGGARDGAAGTGAGTSATTSTEYAADELDEEEVRAAGAAAAAAAGTSPTGAGGGRHGAGAAGAAFSPSSAASNSGRILSISMDLRVHSRAVAGMLLGRGGAPIKSIARQASGTVQAMLDAAVSGQYPSLAPFAGCRLKLDLHVSVKEGLQARARDGRTRGADGSVGQAAALV